MTSSTGPDVVERYLDLLARSLTGALEESSDRLLGVGPIGAEPTLKHRAAHAAGALAQRLGLELRRRAPYDPRIREYGLDWPDRALSMIGLRRMQNIRHCIEAVLGDGVEGDLIETGVWRGGATIFMRGVLAAYGDEHRRVWVADSFAGLPPPDPVRYPADAGDRHHELEPLRVGQRTVEENFRRYGLLDERVRFLPGWFADTLPSAPVDKLALLRLDGDMYSSTAEALQHLYPKLQPGGFCVIDDHHLQGCRRAVADYRREHGIHEPIVDIDGMGVFWRRAAEG